jgi:CRP/FNR family cyclic AMP-dependent transcriptional regulator
MCHSLVVNKLWFLRRVDLFRDISDADMERLGRMLRARACRVGEEIVVRPAGDRIYLVKQGRVRVDSSEVAVAILGPGQLFGTSALFGAATRGQRVVALDEVVICEAPAGEFLAALAAHPRLAAKIAITLARQLFELEQVVARVSSETVEQRLVELVLALARRDGGRYEIRDLSQADLARMIGASRESVSRLLAAWERDGLVRGGQRFVEIVDEPELRRRVRPGRPG